MKHKCSIIILSADAENWSLGNEYKNVLSYFTTGRGDQKIHVIRLT